MVKYHSKSTLKLLWVYVKWIYTYIRPIVALFLVTIGDFACTATINWFRSNFWLETINKNINQSLTDVFSFSFGKFIYYSYLFQIKSWIIILNKFGSRINIKPLYTVKKVYKKNTINTPPMVNTSELVIYNMQYI